MEEILDLVIYEIKRSGYEMKLISGIVLSGGGALLKNIELLCEYRTGLKTRVGLPHKQIYPGENDHIASPIYTTCIGLLMYGLKNMKQQFVKKNIPYSERQVELDEVKTSKLLEMNLIDEANVNTNKKTLPYGANIIKIIGVGSGGSNAVSYMYRQGIVGVDFIIINAENQAMEDNPIPIKVNLGPELNKGQRARSKPKVGKEAYIGSLEEIQALINDNTKMVIITAGMDGGKGTGAAPFVAKVAREMNILTVGIVTVPFPFEGKRRMEQANEGIEEMKKNVDALIIISNEKLSQIYGNLPVSEAFGHVDDILTTAAKGIAEIITMPGYVNVDFEDIYTVMRNSGSPS